MGNYIRDKLEFNGYLHSLRYICNKESVDYFVVEYECDLNRVIKLKNSNLRGSNYILPLLFSDNFEKEFSEISDNNIIERQAKFQSNLSILAEQLSKARTDYCGIGSRNVKLLLNKLSEYDFRAQILRLTLEIEDCSISAKLGSGEFVKYKYYEKENLLYELIDCCNIDNINYGFKNSDINSVYSIIFFDMPFGQISWHTNIEREDNKIYNKKWDGKENSTLSKIEKYIVKNYSEEIERYKKSSTTNWY